MKVVEVWGVIKYNNKSKKIMIIQAYYTIKKIIMMKIWQKLNNSCKKISQMNIKNN